MAMPALPTNQETMRAMTRCLPIIVLLVLAGCEPTAYWDGIPVTQRIESSEHVTEVSFAMLSRSNPLSLDDANALRAAVESAQAGGTVSLDVLTPPDMDAATVVPLLRAVATLGIPVDRIRRVMSAELPPASAQVRIHAVQVKTPVCAGVPSASTSDDTPLSRRKYKFGCASTVNFAAMLADPRDLSAAPAAGAIAGERVDLPIKTLTTKASGQSQSNGAAGAAGGIGATPTAAAVLTNPSQ
jgi:pilus biogenesis lipoprotein CpaD